MMEKETISECDLVLTIRVAEAYEHFFEQPPEKTHSRCGVVSAFNSTNPIVVKAHPDGRIELGGFGEAVAVNAIPAIAKICERNPIPEFFAP